MTKIEAYPWAMSTEAQKAMFDSLSAEQQRDRLSQALIKGMESGDAGLLDGKTIFQKARVKAGLSPRAKNPK